MVLQSTHINRKSNLCFEIQIVYEIAHIDRYHIHIILKLYKIAYLLCPYIIIVYDHYINKQFRICFVKDERF